MSDTQKPTRAELDAYLAEMARETADLKDADGRSALLAALGRLASEQDDAAD